jgi:hypothetical protein
MGTSLTATEQAKESFSLGEGVTRAALVVPYELANDDPFYRPLKIFALDPATSKLEGSIALVSVPFEPLEKCAGGGKPAGIVGRVFRIGNLPGEREIDVNLNCSKVLMSNGFDPSESDRRFHYQMVYAVCSTIYTAFRRALGRPIAWGFDGTLRTRREGDWQLVIYPHDRMAGRNAFYDHWTGEIHFGYYRGEKNLVQGRNLPAGLFYTCLSHDIIVHEVTHALLDGLRARLLVPTHPDTIAFHEAFSDLVAVFQHFTYGGVVRSAIRRSGGDVRRASILTDLAKQFGQTSGHEGGLRTAVDVVSDTDEPSQYGVDNTDPHALGSVLVSAVFEAFTTVFRRKTQRYFDLAGSTTQTAGREFPPVLVDMLAQEASRLADQFLALCTRAIDYCPPVDLRFGEYLRAMITADRDLVPDDQWAYREALVDAFRRRAIFPDDVDHLSEDALIWEKPAKPLTIPALSFAELKFRGDPQNAASGEELVRQASALGKVITQPDLMSEFGLADPDEARKKGMQVESPCIESIRSARRVGPQGQIVFDLVAEVTQTRVVKDELAQWEFYGGSTVILGPNGEVRYVVRKRIDNDVRLERQREFMTGSGQRYWNAEGGRMAMADNLIQHLHSDNPAV